MFEGTEPCHCFVSGSVEDAATIFFHEVEDDRIDGHTRWTSVSFFYTD